MTEAEIQKYFLESPPGKGRNNKVCRALIVFPKKTVPYPAEICHRFLGHAGSTKGCTGYYTSLWYSTKDDLPTAIKFWGYCLGEQSPWRECLTNLRIVRDDAGNPIAFGIDVTDKTSVQIVADLSMAVRIPLEHPCNLRLWEFLVSKGYHPAEALLVASYVKKHGNHLKEHDTRGWHFPLDGGRWLMSVKDLKAGTPPSVDRNKLMQKGSEYLPADEIWKVPGTSEYEGKSHPIWKALSRAVPYEGIFKKRFLGINGDLYLQKNGVITNITEALAALEATRHEW